ncbi:MAG TPA: hypothetical protein VGK67_36760 [Myxococcales bacterium]
MSSPPGQEVPSPAVDSVCPRGRGFRGEGRFQALKIILLGLGAAVGYGILQDNVTARIAPSYFNVAHPDLGYPAIFHHASPTVLAFAWGVVATWWVGFPLGILMALCARAGGWPKLEARALLKPVGKLLGVMIVGAFLGGLLAWGLGISYYAPAGIPLDQKEGWGIDFGAHLAAYFVGPAGGLVLCVLTLLRRRRLSRSLGDPA